MTTFTPDERQQLNVLLLHTHEAGDADGFAAMEKLTRDPAAFRATVASFQEAQGSLPPQAKAFEEAKHPRDHGKFSSKPGGAATVKKPQPTSKTPAKSDTIEKPKVGKKCTPEEHARAVALAKQKATSAPPPTAEEVAKNRAGMAAVGANRYRRNLVGNSVGRAKRRKMLYQEFGDGETCPCVYCGVRIGEGTLEQDKIYTTGEGGRYRPSNLVPSCSACNKTRGDKPFTEFIERIKARAGPGISRQYAVHVDAEVTAEHRQIAERWVAESGLPDDVRDDYTDYAAEALSGLPDAVLKAANNTMMLWAVKRPTFYPDMASLRRRAAEIVSKKKASGLLGFVHVKGGISIGVHLDGGVDQYQAVGTYIHELWHLADDGYHSQTKAWKAAWKAEIKDGRASGPNVSLYALENEEEGLAEFGRYVAEHGPAETKQNFPRCYAALVKQGLLI